MKRRTIILTFAIIALLLVGVGYATLTDTLTVNGTVSTSEANISVIFSKAESTDKDAELGVTGTHEITLGSSALKKEGDVVTFTLTVADASDPGLDAKITELGAVTNNNEEYFSVTYDGLEVDQVIKDGSTGTITVTVELIKTPVETQSVTFKFVVNATAVQE